MVSLGYRVLSAGNADTAYELQASAAADAVLLDIRLPAMSGLALYLAIVHRWPRLEGRIALMSGEAEAPDVRLWLEQNRCTAMQKPFSLQQITGWLDSALHTRQHRAAER